MALVLLAFAIVFAAIASFIMQGYGRWHFGWLAVFFFLLYEMFKGAAGLLH